MTARLAAAKERRAGMFFEAKQKSTLPGLHRPISHQMNQSNAMCRKLHPLGGLILKSCRSPNSTKTLELLNIDRVLGAWDVEKVRGGDFGEFNPTV